MEPRDEIRLVLSKSQLKGLLILALMVGGGYALMSESFTLSTTYPAPSGIYNKMITTGETYLARDTGNVGVGTTNPTAKLHVGGAAGVDGIMFPDGSLQTTALYKTGSSRVSVYNSTGNGSTGVRAKVFAVVDYNVGSDIAYASDSVNGDRFMINTAGTYAVSFTGSAAGFDWIGISKNASPRPV